MIQINIMKYNFFCFLITIQAKTQVFYLVSLDFKTTGQCRITTASKSIPTESNFYLYGMPKGSLYSRIMDEQ